ncbi:aminotransferase class IV [Petroclostridium sp. X23]|uniref:aminotransferase class IV n=1 Tax=Petroclostridium sp. X23 TaxID=3045146 RepID=UPI0024ACCB6A|nr:aminotransferase class IV [Petroclostridium sp. X23]WHH58524.1 aminotransferase class IV [Petroclostridium sp. X23]
MLDNIGTEFILNNTIETADKLKKVNIPADTRVYEVIRIIEKVPLFLEEHYLRLKKSFDLLEMDLNISYEKLREQIHVLVEANQLINCNVKVIVYLKEEVQSSLIYISRSYYPSSEEIKNGVPADLLYLERQNPNIKLVNDDYKKMVSDKIQQNDLFEVLLVNNDDKITEGSRSNAFFVEGKRVFTAPGEYVLKGITRQYILEACKKAGVEVVETLVDVAALNTIDAVFISGTSIKVLPVSNIGKKRYPSGSHSTVNAISSQYNSLIENYIKTHKFE